MREAPCPSRPLPVSAGKLLPWVCRIRTESGCTVKAVLSPGGTAQTALTVHLLTSLLCKVANKQPTTDTRSGASLFRDLIFLNM